MRRVAIVGAGQAGLLLGIGLLRHGYPVTVLAERTPEQVRAGGLVSNQCVFHPALRRERELGVNFWDELADPVERVSFTAPGEVPEEEPALSWQARLPHAAQSVDQRVKVADWLHEFTRRGGEVRYQRADSDDLVNLAREFELLVVAVGRGAQFDALFPRDAQRSRFSVPQRHIGVCYLKPSPEQPPGLSFSLGPHGECFGLPVWSVHGRAYGFGVFARPGGPLDRWAGITSVEQHREVVLDLLREHFPWRVAMLGGAEPAGERELLHGGITPVVRHPVGTLPSGALALAMGDTAVTNDPVGGQGANLAAHAARVYEQAILEHGTRPFDGEFLQATFERFWARARQHTRFNNDLLAPPPPHVLDTMDAAQRVPEVAHRFAALFEDPTDYPGWLGDPGPARAYLDSVG
ncbi:2-polyprenyl-6-methoxyphenol hydroxylase-like FAD-dependent oxidoreductase [Crossiella equi]|uniref:2-polyprenyl-6-methoxyphenol hydroxylase-like FAD-dependent oxidoreductase n=1 Tax=Crossiella equi TaxID=130796 RepID=A0ABS5ARR0_9PSEU|nr:styrene monooxygenase/indole monooxygenase family protein [Crossiella equi]MBP2479254.1 2-polyprenyl-6-methoxyphenol hydroxylase-like FAD-dependent oxidoreductase [Crossiella equi]